MIIRFKADTQIKKIQLLQKSLTMHSQAILIDNAWALIVSSPISVPEEMLESVVTYPDKLYFVKHSPLKKKFKSLGYLFEDKKNIVSIAGPCSIESEKQIFECAAIVKNAGGQILRGGAFKPRTSCYDFQGLGHEGIQWLYQAARAHDLYCVSEVMDVRDLDKVLPYLDIVQVGARNMQNYTLLKELGRLKKPIIIKRGQSATYQEFLAAAEYVLSLGNEEVILCERGIRTYETALRNTLDISAVPYLQSQTHCPVIVDPSHAAGLRQFVPPLAYAALAAGADGIMFEVHPRPDESISDAKQTISPETFCQMTQQLRQLAHAFHKTFGKNS